MNNEFEERLEEGLVPPLQNIVQDLPSPVNKVEAPIKKAKSFDAAENELEEPVIRSFRQILKDAGIHAKSDLLKLDDDQVVKLLSRVVDVRGYLADLAKERKNKP